MPLKDIFTWRVALQGCYLFDSVFLTSRSNPYFRRVSVVSGNWGDFGEVLAQREREG